MRRSWALAAALVVFPAAGGQASSPGVVLSRPADLAQGIGARLGPPFDGARVRVRAASLGERRAAARRQLAEAFFPLTGPRCAEVLERLGTAPPDPARWDALIGEIGRWRTSSGTNCWCPGASASRPGPISNCSPPAVCFPSRWP
ncbi:MAG: hypothetical protein Q9Q13_14140 [Acidobacteriota bacterium]|nr:hypothetical protein [Acidobacteriota bacterium]